MSSTTYHARQNPSRARDLNPGYTSRAVTLYLIKPPFISIRCFIRYNERLPFMENAVILGRIQMEMFIPVQIFRKKQ